MNYLKNTALLAVFVLLPFVGSAQDGNVKTIQKGDFILNPYITLGWYDYGYALDPVNILPPVGLNFEIATSDYFSFGLEADYGTRRYRDFIFVTGSYEYDYTYKALSFRGSFHYLDLLKDLLSDDIAGLGELKLDLYAGISTGYSTTVVNQKWNDGVASEMHERKTFESAWRYGYYFGARYYFSDKFGAFAEGGRGTLGWGKIGLTLKM